MPDIFDELSPAASAGGDIFDQVAPSAPAISKPRSLANSFIRGIKTAQALPDVAIAAGSADIGKPTMRQERKAYEAAMTDPRYMTGLIAADGDPANLRRVESTLGPAAKLDLAMTPARTFQRLTAEDLAGQQAEIAAIPQSPAQQRLAQAQTPADKWRVWMKDPIELTAGIVLESLPPSVAGATIGTAVGGPGVGTAAGAGLSSAAMTFSSEFLGAAGQQGVDVTNPEQLEAFLNNPRAFNHAFNIALTKSAIVGGVDAGTAGAAGRWIEPALKQGLKQRIVASGKELAMQMAGGAGGEAAGQVAAGQKLDTFDVAMEALAEVATAPGEAAGNILAKRQTAPDNSVIQKVEKPVADSKPDIFDQVAVERTSEAQPPNTKTDVPNSQSAGTVAPPTPPAASLSAEQQARVRAELMALPGANDDLQRKVPKLTPAQTDAGLTDAPPPEDSNPVVTQIDNLAKAVLDLQAAIKGNQLKPKPAETTVEPQRRRDAEAVADIEVLPPEKPLKQEPFDTSKYSPEELAAFEKWQRSVFGDDSIDATPATKLPAPASVDFVAPEQTTETKIAIKNGDTVSVVTRKGAAPKAATVIQMQPDGSASVRVKGEKEVRTLAASQIQPSRRAVTLQAKADEIAGFTPEQQAQIKERSAAFRQLVTDYAPLMEWAPAEAYDDGGGTDIKGMGFQKAKLREMAIEKALRAVLPGAQGNSLVDQANALPRLEKYLQEQFPADNSFAERRALRRFKADDSRTEPTPAPERQAQDQRHVERISRQNSAETLLQGIRVARNQARTGRRSPAAVQGNAGGASRGGPVVRAAEAKAFGELERIFRVQIIPVEKQDGTAVGFNGFKDRNSNVLLLDAQTKLPALTIVGHELLHHIQNTHPGLYQDLVDAVFPYLQNVEKYRARMQANGYTKLSDAHVITEILGDFTGDSLTDPAFLNDLARREPTLFKRFARIAIGWLDKLLAKVKGLTNYGSSEFITDIESARAILADTLRQAGTETQMERYGERAADPFSRKGFDTGQSEDAGAMSLRESPDEVQRRQPDLSAAGRQQPSGRKPLQPGQEQGGFEQDAARELQAATQRAKGFSNQDLIRAITAAELAVLNTTHERGNSKHPRPKALARAELDAYQAEFQARQADYEAKYQAMLRNPEWLHLQTRSDRNPGSLSTDERARLRTFWKETNQAGQFSRKQDDVAAAARGELVAYHGSPEGTFQQFNESERGIFFTNKPDLADGYTMRRGVWRTAGKAPKVYTAKLTMRNPLVIEAGGARNNNIPFPGQEYKRTVFGNLPGNAVSVQQAAAKAFEMGHDGVIIRDVMDANDVTDKTRSTVYVVKAPSQIKPASESGQFSLKDSGDSFQFDAPESVAEQKARLATEKRKADQAKAKDAMQERAGARLTSDEDTQTGDMFGGVEGRTTRQDKAGQGSLFSLKRGADEPRNLAAVHNTTAEKLQHMLKMGGLPVPSIAIVRADKAVLEGFGDITLVGTPELVTPSSTTKVLNADAYSPRYPDVKIQIDYNDGKKLVAAFQKYRDEVPAEVGDYQWKASNVLENITDRGWRELKYNHLVRYAYLRDQGLMQPPQGMDIDAVRKEVDRLMEGRADEIPAWAELKVKNLGIYALEKIFKGFTNSGNRSYTPHTLENVVKIMKKGFRDAEGFNYGVGSVRAVSGKQFKNLKGIQADRGKIITKAQMDALKEEVDKEFGELHDYAMPYREGGKNSGFGTLDAFGDDLKAMAEGGGENFRHLREMYPGGEPFEKMRAFLAKLRDLPTEYFEAKPKRAVQLQEFAGAVVPEGTSPELIKQLERRGLDVRTYPKNDKEARRAAVEAIGGERQALFSLKRGKEESDELFPPEMRKPFRKAALRRATEQVLRGTSAPREFVDAREAGLSQQKHVEEALRLTVEDLQAAVRAEFKTNDAIAEADKRLLAFLNGEAEVATVGGPAVQRKAAELRNGIDSLTDVAVSEGLVRGEAAQSWLANRGEWLKRTYLAFDPTSDWNYDTLKRRKDKGDAEIARIWNAAEGYLREQNPDFTDGEIEAQMRGLIDRQEVEDAIGLTQRQIPGSGSRIAVDTTSLLRRKKLPPEIREWMGEIKDPYAKALQSGKWMAQFITRNLVQRRFARIGLEMGLISETKTGPHTVELYEASTEFVPEKDADGNIRKTEDGEPIGSWRKRVDRQHEPLSGFYTTPEFKAALDEFDAKMNNVLGVLDFQSVVGKTFMGITNYQKGALVAWNPASWGVNTLGGLVNRMASSMYSPVVFSKNLMRAYSAVRRGNKPADFKTVPERLASVLGLMDGPATAKNLQARADYLQAVKAGLIGKGILTGDVRANTRREVGKQATRRMIGEISNILKDPKAGGSYVRLREALSDFWQTPGKYGIQFYDNVFRVSAFFDELALAQKAFPEKSFAQQVEWAADRGGNIYQNYDRLPKIIRDASRTGVLNTFVSFKAELFRNAWHIARYAREGMKSDNPHIKADGYRKAAALATMALVPYVLAAWSRADKDVDDEKDKALKRWIVAPWDRSDELVYLHHEGTKYGYVPMGYIFPTFELTRPGYSIWNAINDPNPDEALQRAASGWMTDYFGPGAVIGPLAEGAFNMRMGQNRPLTLAEGSQGVQDRLGYVANNFTPRAFRMAGEAYMAATGQTGDYGREYSLREINAKLAGLRQRTVDVEKAAPYVLRGLASRWRDASTYQNTEERKAGKVKERAAAATAYEKDTKANLQKLYQQAMKDLELLGVSKTKLRAIEKESHIPTELREP